MCVHVHVGVVHICARAGQRLMSLSSVSTLLLLLLLWSILLFWDFHWTGAHWLEMAGQGSSHVCRFSRGSPVHTTMHAWLSVSSNYWNSHPQACIACPFLTDPPSQLHVLRQTATSHQLHRTLNFPMIKAYSCWRVPQSYLKQLTAES